MNVPTAWLNPKVRWFAVNALCTACRGDFCVEFRMGHALQSLWENWTETGHDHMTVPRFCCYYCLVGTIAAMIGE